MIESLRSWAKKNIPKSVTKHGVEIVFVLLLFFRQIVFYISPNIGYQLAGNLDIFYLLGFIYIVKHIRQIRLKNVLPVVGLLIVYLILQMLITVDNINILRWVINVSKIILCFYVLRYAMNKSKKIDLYYITTLFGSLCFIMLCVAFIFHDSGVLWRLNDTINVFDLKRLQLLYTEPGELGMHCSIILIIALYFVINRRTARLSYIIFTILPITTCLMLTRSLGSIAVGAIGACAVIVSDLIAHPSKRKLAIAGITFTIFLIIVGIMIVTNDTLYLRLMQALNGGDSSSRYRIGLAFRLVPQVLQDTLGLGIGFGNLELRQNVNTYSTLGLQTNGIINSFMNFIAEGGILSIAVVGVLIFALVRKCVQTRNPIKIGLTAFLIIYQFMGAYFTNPLCWILYGYILTNTSLDRQTVKHNKQKRRA